MLSKGCPLFPSSSLPPLRKIELLAEADLFATLDNLTRLYCPLVFSIDTGRKHSVGDVPADSGYVSDAEGENGDDALTALRADGFERTLAERWLTGFIARVEELSCFKTDEARERALDQASCVLESFFTCTIDEEERLEQLAQYSRDFTFSTSSRNADLSKNIEVRLNDGLAGQNSEEPDDVGLQSWGASIVFSKLMCDQPERFGLTKETLGHSPRIIELGAGTGLVSLALSALLPRHDITDATIVATDYHPAVMDNLRANIAANPLHAPMIEAAALDWSKPSRASPLDVEADVLLATDVIYTTEHAVWIRDCATQFLKKDGIFWLVATVRDNGRFEGVSNTVKAAFGDEGRPRASHGKRLTVLKEERLGKLDGVGRGDESGYKMFRIAFA
ncbi:uncharacterized protein J7T54_003829 [Emericellopsis cladophorae]|uniref:Methyltransferase domain-containing protein n=1 Tax=Emericellopsis cladophorae TaxID=2686198 RepID=A0A9P9XWL1_9HYPO|nr:uncharacterized protein J7T54_003829 [Emericellopsis cladophorae]KAI6778893.1 hypothetical protein J7T54_003829 [Emericellopsis cladophorae]